MFGLCTSPEHRGRGVATELVRQALEVAKKADCQGYYRLWTNFSLCQLSQNHSYCLENNPFNCVETELLECSSLSKSDLP